MAGDSLEPIAPRDAVEWYLEHRRDDARVATHRKIDSALGIFVDWTHETGIDNMNDVRGRELMRFKTWRKSETEIESVSLNGALAVLRRFLVFCDNIDAVEANLYERVPMPNVPAEEEISDVVPADAEVDGIRSYYDRFEYASRRHIEIECVAEVGFRLGALRAIDLCDLDFDDRRVHLRHRPEGPDEYGTPLKNGEGGERVGISHRR